MRVFITGITGTLGTALAILHHSRGDTVVGCSRNEERVKSWTWKHGGIWTMVMDACRAPECLEFQRADRIYHTAAMKHVDLCEQNPLEAWRQNVELTAKVVNDRCVVISSDKAVGLAMGVYGCTKKTAEVIALQAGAAVVRFGNLIGSSGSVLPLWKEATELTLTDPEMTRYFLSVKEAARFAVDKCLFKQLNVPLDMKSIKMGELAKAFGKPVKVTGPRLGETKHQWLAVEGEVVNGGRLLHSLSSQSAPKWDAKELLEEMP